MEFIFEPKEIENKSMEIIKGILGDKDSCGTKGKIIRRVIHTTADFDYTDSLIFSAGAVTAGVEALKSGANIVTDTKMAMAGVNKKSLEALGCSINCFIDSPAVCETAKANAVTRSSVAIEYAVKNLEEPLIFAIGNAPTALISLYELVTKKGFKPELIIAVPVGFVNVIEAKEMILSLDDVPFIVAKGRKGGSNVAAAILNALIYELARL